MTETRIGLREGSRKRVAPWVAAGAILVAALTGFEVFGHPHTANADQPITIDATSGEVFTPMQAPANLLLSSKAALSRYSQKTSGQALNAIPDGVVVQYGLLSLANGDPAGAASISYVYRDKPVWAFSVADQCAIMSSGGPEEPQGDQCTATFWMFLDASDGSMLDQTWQQ
jgi:hypothetical protein